MRNARSSKNRDFRLILPAPAAVPSEADPAAEAEAAVAD